MYELSWWVSEASCLTWLDMKYTRMFSEIDAENFSDRTRNDGKTNRLSEMSASILLAATELVVGD